MRPLFLLIFLSLFSAAAFGQSESTYYYSGGERINLSEDPETVVLHFDPQLAVAVSSLTFDRLNKVEVHPEQGRALLTFAGGVNAEDLTPARLGLPSESVHSIEQGIQLEDGFKLALTHEVVAGFSDPANLDSPDFQQLLEAHGARWSKAEFGVQFFQVAQPRDAITLSNLLVENAIADWAHPDFYAEVTRYNDPLYPQQFQMNNTGQTVNNSAGVAGIDCNAPDAWAITTGDPSLTIAIIDDGLAAHEDLVDGEGNTRILPGYTPATGGNGAPRFSFDAHGMACAGIAAATHNNSKGIRGMAPEVKLRSVNIFWGGETTSQLAGAINWARIQGADVLSNSWGYTSCLLSLDVLNTALSNAQSNGRDGLGCVVVFAAGNDSYTCITYPANQSSVIAVGAVTNQGQHSAYSNKGSQLSLVAPSSPSPGQNGGFVRTIDRMGNSGYNNGNYYGLFGGTSASCPAVSGVAALILAIDPNLTSTEVQTLMETTATDMGTSGFDTTYGYGRVNAGDAVAAAADDANVPEPEPCIGTEAILSLTLDNYPGETTWTLSGEDGVNYASGGPYAGLQNVTITEEFCLPDGCYSFTIFDSYGDGICCSWGAGSYSLETAEGDALASGGAFDEEEATAFCIGEEEEPEPEPVPCVQPYPQVQDLEASVQENGVLLNWTPIPGSIVCHVYIGSGPTGAFVRYRVGGQNLSSHLVSPSFFSENGVYNARVRCGCSLSPSILGPLSDYAVYEWNGGSNISAFDMPPAEAIMEQLHMTTYPNPTSGDLQVEVTTTHESQLVFRLYDLLGKLVFTQNENANTGKLLYRFDLSGLDESVYLMQVANESGMSTFSRIVVTK